MRRSACAVVVVWVPMALLPPSTGLADTFEAPDTVAAQPDGTFSYRCKFVKGPGPADALAAYGWSGQENVGGGFVADCFCAPQCALDVGDSVAFTVSGQLTDPAWPGRVEQSVSLCLSSGQGSSTHLRPYSTAAVGDPVSGDDLLFRNEPNPFSTLTTFRYALREAGPVRLRVYDAAGRLVATVVEEVQPAGRQSATWDARGARSIRRAAGVYFARLMTRDGARTRTLVITR